MIGRTPRGWLGASRGVFSLSNSDRYCGSYIAIGDVAAILQTSAEALAHIPRITHGDTEFMSDRDLGRAWASGQISSPRSSYRRGSATVSFDELLLITLFERRYPEATIRPQEQIGRKLVDFYIKNGREERLIEFFGPYHFIQRGARHIRHPFDRKKALEDETGIECVIWPYWVQRCDSNVSAVFDTSAQGLGSLWSTNAHFGDFLFSDSASLIIDINRRFGIDDPKGVGYFYTDEKVNKPVHPIVAEIKMGHQPLTRLLPRGFDTNAQRYWLPSSLWLMAGNSL